MWTSSDIPDQTGRVAIVTGANTGIGLEPAAALGSKNATVVLACRNRAKAEASHDQCAVQHVARADSLRNKGINQATGNEARKDTRQKHVT